MGKRAFIFFRLVATITLLKLFSTLQESYLMVILFLPFKLILFQYGTFAVIIILLLHAIPSIMNGKYYCLGKGFVVGFVEDFFFFLILSTAIISELIYSLKSPLSTALLHSVASKGGKLLLQSSKSYKKVLQLFC